MSDYTKRWDIVTDGMARELRDKRCLLDGEDVTDRTRAFDVEDGWVLLLILDGDGRLRLQPEGLWVEHRHGRVEIVNDSRLVQGDG